MQGIPWLPEPLLASQHGVSFRGNMTWCYVGAVENTAKFMEPVGLIKCGMYLVSHIPVPRGRLITGNLWRRFQCYFPVQLCCLIFTAHSSNIKPVPMQNCFRLLCIFGLPSGDWDKASKHKLRVVYAHKGFIPFMSDS
jgi:hypothetical protein